MLLRSICIDEFQEVIIIHHKSSNGVIFRPASAAYVHRKYSRLEHFGLSLPSDIVFLAHLGRSWETELSNPQTEAVNLTLDSSELELLSVYVRGSRFLKSLSLTVRDRVSRQLAESLQSGLMKNRSLKEITMKLMPTGAGVLKMLVEAIAKNPCVISLTLSHTLFPPPDTSGSDPLTSKSAEPELLSLALPSINLRFLRVAGCKLSSAELSVISTCLARGTCSLTLLELSGNPIPVSNTTLLVAALQANTLLTTLKLSHCRLGDDGAILLSSIFPQNTTLSHLNISANEIGPKGAKSLALGFDKSSSLGHLNLSHNPIQYEGFADIFTTLANKDLIRELNLAFCSFDAQSWTLLAEKLNTCTRLWKLDVSGNMTFKLPPPSATTSSPSLDPSPLVPTQRANAPLLKALEELCSALQVNSSISILDLSHNAIGDSGCKTLSGLLSTNQTLVDLKLRRCSITSYGVSHLADSIGEGSGLSFVDTTGNEAEGLGHLEVSLIRNRRKRCLAWRPVSQHPIVQTKPHAEFTCVCPVPSAEEIWVACTDGHVHFWPVADDDNVDDVMHYVDVHTKATPVTRRRINGMVPTRSTVWVLTDESTIVVISQQKPRRISYLPMKDIASERLCMDIVDPANQIAVVGGGSGDISMWKTAAGEEAMVARKVLGAGLPVVAVCVTPQLILAGLVMPGRHSSIVVVMDHSMDELYRKEVGSASLIGLAFFNGTQVITTFEGGSSKLWHCDSREMALIRTENHVPITTMQTVADQALFLSSSTKRSNLCLWNPSTLNPICTIDTPLPVKTFAMSNTYLALLTEDEQVSFWMLSQPPA